VYMVVSFVSIDFSLFFLSGDGHHVSYLRKRLVSIFHNMIIPFFPFFYM